MCNNSYSFAALARRVLALMISVGKVPGSAWSASSSGEASVLAPTGLGSVGWIGSMPEGLYGISR